MHSPYKMKAPASSNQTELTSKHGIDAQVQKKMASKYDKDLEKRVVTWISAVTGNSIGDFPDDLKDGITLCQFANKLKPGVIKKYNKKPRVAFQKVENVGIFLKALRSIGMDESEIFDTSDLINERSLNQVILCFDALGRRARSLSSFNGPHLEGALKMNKGQKKKWSKQQIKKGGLVGTLMERKQQEVAEKNKVGPKLYDIRDVARHGVNSNDDYYYTGSSTT